MATPVHMTNTERDKADLLIAALMQAFPTPTPEQARALNGMINGLKRCARKADTLEYEHEKACIENAELIKQYVLGL